MKDSKESSDELLELLGAAWDERLDAASFSRLEELLTNDREGACDVLVAFSRLQVELAWLAASSQAHEKALSLLAPYFAESEKAMASTTNVRAKTSSAVSSPLEIQRARFNKRRYFAIAAGLLLPLAAVAWYSLSGNPRNFAGQMRLLRAPQKVARLASVDAAVWQDGARYDAGDLFATGERLHLLRGSAQVSMVAGADILLQAPCVVELISQSHVRLQQGKLTAQAAKWAKGFVVDTESLRITDLGTRFAVSAESPSSAEAHIFEGAVRAEPLQRETRDKDTFLVVTAGQAVKWNESARRLDRIQVDYSRFVEKLPQFRPLYPIAIANTGPGLSPGSLDPRWRIIAGHSSGGSFPAPAVVCAPAAGYMDNAPQQSQWISVRGGTTRGVKQHTQYTFETKFDLTGVDPATVELVGQILVDNRVQEIRLNGKRVDVQPWEGVYSQDFQRFHVVEIREGFTSGVNRLEIDVINGALPDGSDNPMAIRAEWQAFGCAEGG